MDILSRAEDRIRYGGWMPKAGYFRLGQVLDNLDTLGKLDLYFVLRKLGSQHNKLANASGGMAANDGVSRLEAALESERAKRVQLELALAELQARCDVLTERYQAAIDSQVAALKDYFGGSFADLATARDEIVASAAQARDGAAQAAALLDEFKDEFAAAREVIPQLADTAVREVVAAVQEEPSILALALGNAERFTSTIAKTVER